MKRSKTPTTVTTAILTLITIFFWAGLELYHTLTTKPEPTVPQEIISAINPSLDLKSLNQVALRPVLNESEIGNFTITQITPTPISTSTPIVSPVASQSAQPSVSPLP